MKLLLD